VPLVPQGAQIWNTVIPIMIQQVLTGKASPKEAAQSAAEQVRQMMA
jgi:maltose-binding protein MalE